MKISQRAVQIVRTGRKRKPGKRHPNGDLANERTTEQEMKEARILAFKQPHRQSVPEEKRTDPECEWPLGRAFLRGEITAMQLQAAKNYGRDVQRYRAILLPEAPNPSPASIAGYMQPGNGGSHTADEEKIQERYDAVFESLEQAVGPRGCRAVARVAVFNEGCPQGAEKLLKLGLNALVDFYGLTNARKSRQFPK